MPIQEMPKFNSIPEKNFELPQPAIGGLNLREPEFEQGTTQSPYMLNMMYKNGALRKRYGQTPMQKSSGDVAFGTIYNMEYYDGYIFVLSNGTVYRYKEGSDPVNIGEFATTGKFVVYNQNLYFVLPQNTLTRTEGIYVYKTSSPYWTYVDPYIPDVLINCKPDGSHADPQDQFNLLGRKFSYIYNGENVQDYRVGEYDGTNLIDWGVDANNKHYITVEVDDVLQTEETDYTVDDVNKIIKFNSYSSLEGDLNIKFTFRLRTISSEPHKIYSFKYHETYGGANNSRLFVGGCGNSKYYWSDSYDISYFPEDNFGIVGDRDDDITGFGKQYNALIVFKPDEIYSVTSFTQTTQTTLLEEEVGLEGFRSQLVNGRVGCDEPRSIQLVNNLLTWVNSKVGVCTLASTSVIDERNVRTISRNVDYTNDFGVVGIIDLIKQAREAEYPYGVFSADYDNKYFLFFPYGGYCYMWDYEIQPYTVSSRGETDPKTLCWFLFDHFRFYHCLNIGTDLLFSTVHSDTNYTLVKLDDSLTDFDYSFPAGVTDKPIHSYYMTPYLQFGAVEYIKNVKNIYIQCKNVPLNTSIKCYTDESLDPVETLDNIQTGEGIWGFTWNDFQWHRVNVGRTFRRRCNLKHIQMASFLFENNEAGKDLSLTHIGVQYQIVRYIK